VNRKKNYKVVLTGGGTAGHVVPNLAFADILAKKKYEVTYIGSGGMEKALVTDKGLPFLEVTTGKLRRELTLRNLLMPFKVLWGLVQSFMHLWRINPVFVFSKGGYVSVPVCLAAWALRIPCYSHESDLSPGLANKILQRFTKRFFYSFPQSKKFLPASAECVGSPIRPEVFEADRSRGSEFLDWQGAEGPVLFVVGGSLGSVKLNEAIKGAFGEIMQSFRVVHITGEGKDLGLSHSSYRSYPYLKKEYTDVLAASDFVLARAGANSIFEFLALKKPMLLMPLVAGSRGDQVENAQSFAGNGWAHTLDEGTVSPESLLTALALLVETQDKMRGRYAEVEQGDAFEKIWESIAEDLPC